MSRLITDAGEKVNRHIILLFPPRNNC